jgi:hypothetical protein
MECLPWRSYLGFDASSLDLVLYPVKGQFGTQELKQLTGDGGRYEGFKV